MFRKRLKPLSASGEERCTAGGEFDASESSDQINVSFGLCITLRVCFKGSDFQRDANQSEKMSTHPHKDHLPAQPGALLLFVS